MVLLIPYSADLLSSRLLIMSDDEKPLYSGPSPLDRELRCALCNVPITDVEAHRNPKARVFDVTARCHGDSMTFQIPDPDPDRHGLTLFARWG